ncbi:MAG: hypothetical protein ACLTSG_02135 [Lachnospiraceae bacterium]
MRLIPAAAVTDCVRRLCLAANRRRCRPRPRPPCAAPRARSPGRPPPGPLDELCRNLDAARRDRPAHLPGTRASSPSSPSWARARGVEGFEEAVQ